MPRLLCYPAEGLDCSLRFGGVYTGDMKFRGRDVTGQRFTRLVVIERVIKVYNGTRQSVWRCKCDCGKESVVLSYALISGRIKSCGCLGNTKHGEGKTKFYGVWRSMKDRCLNVRHPVYHHYGDRGITICQEWIDNYLNFKRDMLEGYGPGLSIDRIDNNKGYYKENCRWTNMQVQTRNTRFNRIIDTPYGRVTLAEASELSGIHVETLRSRLRGKHPGYLLFATKRINPYKDY